MKVPKKTLASTGVTLLILYLGVCTYFYFVQSSIIFHPGSLSPDHTYDYEFSFEERLFEMEDGTQIHAILAKTTDSLKGLVIYYHGNAGTNQTSPEKFDLFMDLGYDVLYPDYRGFGKSGGELVNEESLVGDMKHIYSEMTKEYAEKNIVIVGYSLGSGVAAQVAAVNDPKMVMIWAPYYSMVDMKNMRYPFLPDFLVRFPLRTDRALTLVDEPVYIFYAGDDEVLPIDRSIKLTEFLDGNDEYLILDGQGHNRIFNNPVLIEKTQKILAGN